MSEAIVNRVSGVEQMLNTRLLSTFECIFSASDFNNLKGILHPSGKYFGKLNYLKACGYFYTLFFGKDGSSEKFHMEVNRGVSMDQFAGEVVLELRCSTFDPFSDDPKKVKKEFGEKADQSINETVYRFAFSFKDDKIFTIRIPGKCCSEITNMIQNN